MAIVAITKTEPDCHEYEMGYKILLYSIYNTFNSSVQVEVIMALYTHYKQNTLIIINFIVCAAKDKL